MPRYLLLIHGDENVWDERTEQETLDNDEAHRAFNATAGAAVLDGGALDSSTKVATVRTAAGSGFLVSDGPYVETKEVVGGYYLVEVADRDEAVRLAKLVPEASAPTSWVEVWPVM